MDAPPIPRLVDLVHVFKGLVVEQFKKRLEKLLSDSILLWRLLKLLFKILQWRSWVGYPFFDFFFHLFIQYYWFSLLHLFLLFSGSFFPMKSDEDNTPQQQQEESDADPLGKNKCSSEPNSLFPLSESSWKAQRREAQFKLFELQCKLDKLKLEAEDDAEGSDVAKKCCRRKSRKIYQECPIKPEKFPGRSFNRWELWVKHY